MLTYMVMLPMPSSKLGVRNVIAEFISVDKTFENARQFVSQTMPWCVNFARLVLTRPSVNKSHRSGARL